MTYDVVKLPIPSSPEIRSDEFKYPLNKLEVGDSFVVPNADDKEWRSINNACRQRGSKWNRVFCMFRFIDQSIQVWREQDNSTKKINQGDEWAAKKIQDAQLQQSSTDAANHARWRTDI